MPITTISIQNNFGGSHWNTKERKRKNLSIGKKEMDISLLTENMAVHIENPN